MQRLCASRDTPRALQLTPTHLEESSDLRRLNLLSGLCSFMKYLEQVDDGVRLNQLRQASGGCLPQCCFALPVLRACCVSCAGGHQDD